MLTLLGNLARASCQATKLIFNSQTFPIVAYVNSPVGFTQTLHTPPVSHVYVKSFPAADVIGKVGLQTSTYELETTEKFSDLIFSLTRWTQKVTARCLNDYCFVVFPASSIAVTARACFRIIYKYRWGILIANDVYQSVKVVTFRWCVMLGFLTDIFRYYVSMTNGSETC